MREVVIRAGKVSIRARLLDTPTADRIWAALPLAGHVKTWGQEIYFHAPVSHDLEPGARAVATKGEIAFWPDGDAISIGFGPTPLSKRGEIRFTSPCNIWAMAIDDVNQLRGVYAGESITVASVDEPPQWLAGVAAGDGLCRHGAATHTPQPMHAGQIPDDDKR